MGLFGQNKVGLEAKISADTDQYNRALDRSKKKTRHFTQDASRRTRRFGSIAKKSFFAVGAATIAATAATVKMLDVLTDLGDEIDKNSKRMGVNVKQYQDLKLISGLTGSSQKALIVSFQKLNQAIDDARQSGARYQSTFARLGISRSDLNSQSSLEIFYQVRRSLSGIADEATRTGIAIDILGQRGQKDLAPLLAMSAEEFAVIREQAEKTAKLQEDFVAASASAKDEMLLIKTGVMALLGSGMTPLVQELVVVGEEARKWLSDSENQAVVIETIRDVISQAVGYFGAFYDIAKMLRKPLMFAAGFLTSIAKTVKFIYDMVALVLKGLWWAGGKVASWFFGGDTAASRNAFMETFMANAPSAFEMGEATGDIAQVVAGPSIVRAGKYLPGVRAVKGAMGTTVKGMTKVGNRFPTFRRATEAVANTGPQIFRSKATTTAGVIEDGVGNILRGGTFLRKTFPSSRPQSHEWATQDNSQATRENTAVQRQFNRNAERVGMSASEKIGLLPAGGW